MGLAFAVTEILLRQIADLEFRLSSPGDKLTWRKRWLRTMRVTHGDDVWWGPNVYLRNRGQLHLGNRCAIGGFSRIWNYAPIYIGDDFLSAGGLTLNSATHDPVTLAPIGKEIRIGRRVWCGLNVTILAGTQIGDDVVVGAGSVVCKDLPSQCIAVGVPARKIKDLSRDPDQKLHSPWQ